jgi:hypothetical protein
MSTLGMQRHKKACLLADMRCSAGNADDEALVFKSTLASATITRTDRDDSSEVAEDFGRNRCDDTKR